MSSSQQTAVLAAGPTPSVAVRAAWWRGARAQSWGLAGVFFALYCCLSVRRQQQMLSTGFDLGIFEQGIRAYAHGHAPVSLLKGPGFDLLGDHFHPLLVLFAPFYRLFPSPMTLLVGQAALTALAIVPLTGWAHRVRGPWIAAWTGLGYGASWGIAALIGFDFHEVCMALPLLAFALAAAGQQRWRAAALWGLPLLLVKEDLGLTLAALGGYIACKGPRRLGLTLVAVGVLGTALEMLVILPSFNPHGSFDYWNEITSGGTAASAPARTPLQTVLHTFWPFKKYVTVLMLLVPTGFLALRSPLVLLALPTLAWRFVSVNPQYWGTGFHYDAVPVVIVFAAAVDALDKHRAGPLRGRRLAALCAVGVLATAFYLPRYPLAGVFQPHTWTTTPRVRAATLLLERIPDGATVATTDRLAPQLTDRAEVSLLCTADPPTVPPDWLLVDGGDTTNFPCPTTRMLAIAAAEQRSGAYRLVARADGILLLHRLG